MILTPPVAGPKINPKFALSKTAFESIAKLPVVAVNEALPFTEIEPERSPAEANSCLKPAESFVVESGRSELIVNVASSTSAIVAGEAPNLNKHRVPLS